MHWFYYASIYGFLLNICDTYFPETAKYVPGPLDLKTRNYKQWYKNPNLYLRHVICLGDDAEAVEAVCCSGSIPKSWLIILPTRRKVHCSRPDCSYICTSAIIANRHRKHTMEPPILKYNPFEEKFFQGNSSEKQSVEDNGNQVKMVNIDLNSRNSKKILKVPNLVLEILWLCENINKSEGNISSQGLKSICKSTNVGLHDFLNQLEAISATVTEIPSLDCNTESVMQSTGLCNDDEVQCTDVCDYETNITQVTDYPFDIIDNRFNSISPNDPFTTGGITEGSPANTKTKTSISLEKVSSFSIVNRTIDSKATETLTDDKEGSTLKYTKRSSSIFDRLTYPTMGRTSRATKIPKMTTVNLEGTSKAGPLDSSTNELILNTTEDVISFTINPTCCCKCSKKTSEFDKKKIKDILMAILSMPRPCQHPVKGPGDGIREVPKFLESYKPSASVEHYVSYINKIYMHVCSEYKQAEWNYETNITQYNKQKAMVATLQLSQFQENIKKALESLHDVPIRDNILERQIKRLYMPGMSISSGLQKNELEQTIYAMQTIYASASINKWKGGNEKVNLVPVISQAMASSTNTDELKYYWTEWRNVTGKRIRSLFEQYILLMDATAKENGFHDASDMWMRFYECEDFMDSLSIHWEEIKPLYSQLHAYVRHRLHAFYGDTVGAKDSGKIPAHLTGDIWTRDWNNLFNKVSPYKNKSSFIDEIMSSKRKKLSPKHMARTVEKTFLSLGFSKLPDTFWKKSIFERRSDAVMSCEPSAWDMFNGTDLRIKVCAQSNLEGLHDIYHQMTICEYFKECGQLPFAFRDQANPAFFEGVAGAVQLSTKTPSHMKHLKLQYRPPSNESDINDLMKIALKKVAFLPYSYILDLWRYKVFRGEIDNTNYNTKWWEMRSRYQGISPPLDRTENDFDVGAKLHIASNQPYVKYFVSTIMEFQFHEALCKKANYKGPIHRCDFTGSPAAGDTIRKVMRMGASNHWRVAMQEMTGVRRLDSTPLLRYFQPLFQWLIDKNKEENITVGWDE